MEMRKGYEGEGPNHLMHLVDLVRRRFGEAIRAELADHPYTDVRRSELRLLLLVPPAGTDLTELAKLTAVTKQSLSEFVEQLQRAGYLTTETSPHDRRVKRSGRPSAATRPENGYWRPAEPSKTPGGPWSAPNDSTR